MPWSTARRVKSRYNPLSKSQPAQVLGPSRNLPQVASCCSPVRHQRREEWFSEAAPSILRGPHRPFGTTAMPFHQSKNNFRRIGYKVKRGGWKPAAGCEFGRAWSVTHVSLAARGLSGCSLGCIESPQPPPSTYLFLRRPWLSGAFFFALFSNFQINRFTL